MTSNLPLYESGRATADANGVATVTLRASRWGEWWRIKGSTVNGNSVLEPQAKVYRGFVSDSAIIGGSNSANLDTATGDDYIPPNESVICQWTGATPGAQFTFTITGERGVG
jgi:hypothetical protein